MMQESLGEKIRRFFGCRAKSHSKIPPEEDQAREKLSKEQEKQREQLNEIDGYPYAAKDEQKE